MNDLRHRIMQIIGQPHLAGLATINDDGLPWVRYVYPVADDKMTIRFATFLDARKVRQIENNPQVHLTCGVTNPAVDQHYLQVQGTASLRSDRDIRHRFWNPTLEEIFTGPDDPRYGVVEVIPYRIEFNSIGSYEPEVWTA